MAETLLRNPLPKGMEFQRSSSTLFRGDDDLALYKDGRYLAGISFKKGNPNELLYISTIGNSGIGLSRWLIRGFIAEAGHGALLVSDIIHDDTWTILRERGLLYPATINGSLTVRDKSMLEMLPFCRILRSGGIQINTLNIACKEKVPVEYPELLVLVDQGEKELTDFFTVSITGRM